MKVKKTAILGILILLIIIISILIIINYKNKKDGNNIINKSEEEIIDYILNINSYDAKLDITVETNKNKTQYVIMQQLKDGKSFQEVIEPKNISGVVTEYDGVNLRIKNNKLNLETIYENYKYMVENNLWLDSFIKDYKNSQNRIYETNNDEIMLEVRKQENLYSAIKRLYISKKTGKPIKMIVQDINQKTLIYILYTEIEISK